jgi:FAD/FMN-containing dehydrogenase
MTHGWAGTNHGSPHHVLAPASVGDFKQIFATGKHGSLLACGLGRSYGDCALNENGTLIDCRFLNNFLSFDPESGVLECEAGVSLLEINRLLTSAGWMLPVTPGTQFVTIGGAIANDVHGKNHPREGSFGTHVTALKIARSNGEVLKCSLENNEALFAATIGGLGLTGLILSAKLQLRPLKSLSMDVNRIPFENLAELFALVSRHIDSWEYHTAWMDPAAGCRKGHYILANHSVEPGNLNWSERRSLPLGLLAGLPSDLPGRLFMKAANLWFRKGVRSGHRQDSMVSTLYPLDRIPDWNLLFGKPGFFQYQCVFPEAVAQSALDELLKVIGDSGQVVTLAVGKWFGTRSTPGLLSFPLPGFSVALDFVNNGSVTRRLLDSLDSIVGACNGRLYPAKDGRMPSSLFADTYPALEKFGQQLDPLFVSDFWRRMEQRV